MSQCSVFISALPPVQHREGREGKFVQFRSLEAPYHPYGADRSTLDCDLCHLSYCNYIVLMFYVLFGIKSELYIEVMVHGAMEHVVVKLSVCRNYVELLADVCLFVLCSHVIMSPALLNFYCPDDGPQSLAPLFVCKSIPIILMFEG